MLRALNLQEHVAHGRAQLALAPGAVSPSARARASSSPSHQRILPAPDGGAPGAKSGLLPGTGVGVDESTSLMSEDILGLGGVTKVAFAPGQGLDESKGESSDPAGVDKVPAVSGAKGAGGEGGDDDDDWDPNSSLEQLSKSLLLGGPDVHTSSKADKGLPGALAQPSLTGYLIREEGSVSFRPATKGLEERTEDLIASASKVSWGTHALLQPTIVIKKRQHKVVKPKGHGEVYHIKSLDEIAEERAQAVALAVAEAEAAKAAKIEVREGGSS